MTDKIQTYFLILHDFGNLQSQVIMYHQIKEVLDEAADKMNFLFQSAGRLDQFTAEVHLDE